MSGERVVLQATATRLHLFQRLRIHGAITPIPHSFSGRGAQLINHSDNFTFILSDQASALLAAKYF
jgi:hypothetical protein